MDARFAIIPLALPGRHLAAISAWLSSRRSRHCPFMMLISVSAMFTQLPCLGV